MVRFKPMGEAHWREVNQHLPLLRAEDTVGLVAVDDEENLLAAAVYDNNTGQSVQAHLLIRNKMVIRHGWLDLIFDFAWDHLGVIAIYGLVPASKTAALKLNRKLGFTELARMTEAFAPGVDYVLMELRKENCRHGKEKSGQRRR